MILSLLFPPRCALCDAVIKGKKHICRSCVSKLLFLGEDVCIKCGKPVEAQEEYCHDCKKKKHAFEQNMAVFSYETVRESLYRFKYAGRAEYADFYAEGAMYALKDKIAKIHAQALIPVPLHKSRLRKRGYNQAQLFAEALGKRLGIPVYTHLVRRVKNTIPMKKLQGRERQNNLKKAFLISENGVKLNTIILVDDIYTTGATLDELSTAFKEAGVENVYCITVAIGNGL